MTVEMPKGAYQDANGKFNKAGHNLLANLIRAVNSGSGTGGSSGGGFTQFEETVLIEVANDQAYPIVVNRSFPGRITGVTTKTRTGTCRVTTQVNGTDIGTYNSASTSEQTITHDVEFATGDDWSLVFSLTQAARGVSVNIHYTRT